MFLIDRIKLLHACLGLSAPRRPEVDMKIGVVESEAAVYVEQIERHFGLKAPREAQLGTQARVVELEANPLLKSKKQVVAFSGHYSIGLCKLNPDLFFIFGDNMQRVGMGGQAIIRQQPNILGVATKRDPGNGFMHDCPFDMGQVMSDLMQVDKAIAEGKRVVVPITREGRISLGCGLAELPYRAPLIYAMIEAWFRSLKNVETVK